MWAKYIAVEEGIRTEKKYELLAFDGNRVSVKLEF